MARRKQLPTQFDGFNHWFSVKYAATLLGVRASTVLKMAEAGELVFQTDKDNQIVWIAETDVTAQRQKRLAKQRTEAKKKPKPRTTAQLEREWAKAPKLNEIPYRLGPVSHHLEKIMLSELNKKKGDS